MSLLCDWIKQLLGNFFHGVMTRMPSMQNRLCVYPVSHTCMSLLTHDMSHYLYVHMIITYHSSRTARTIQCNQFQCQMSDPTVQTAPQNLLQCRRLWGVANVRFSARRRRAMRRSRISRWRGQPLNRLRGLPDMMSKKIRIFWPLPPLVRIWNWIII